MSIIVRNLIKHFGDFAALDDVSLEFAAGELVALIGPSGCGKTTLLRVIAGLEAPDAGEVMLGGRDVAGLDARERRIGFVFQHYALFHQMTVFENVAFGLRVKPRRERPSEAAIRSRVHELLSLVQLAPLADRYPSSLSGGQRQRIALARALAVEPSVLLLDEPFGALDAKVRKELRAWLRRLHDELAISTIFVTHDQEEALDVADRIVVMNHGRVEQSGSPASVYDDPRTPFVYGFLGEANRFVGRVGPQGFVAQGARGPFAANDSHASQSLSPGADAPGADAHAYVRPHELEIHPRRSVRVDGIDAQIRRVVPRGAMVRIELTGDAGPLEAELERGAWHALGLREGDGVTVVPKTWRAFAPS